MPAAGLPPDFPHSAISNEVSSFDSSRRNYSGLRHKGSAHSGQIVEEAEIVQPARRFVNVIPEGKTSGWLCICSRTRCTPKNASTRSLNEYKKNAGRPLGSCARQRK
ncbi:hypothetical protein BC827DRAFT_1229551 [Russula dissimulans]|nr:hypothetical protein BC827DRAFT_1229551 [Russula dissimulans]